MPTPGNHSRGNSDQRIRRQRNKRIRREGDKIARTAQIIVKNEDDEEDSEDLSSLGLTECMCYPGSWCLGDATEIDLELLSVQLDVEEMELELQVARLITMP